MVAITYLTLLAAATNSVQSKSLQNMTQDIDPEAYLNRSIEALGGAENISRMKSVILIGPRVYRIRSVPETLSLDGSMDTSVVVAGGQNMSYSYDQPFFKQRLDRKALLGSLWYYAKPALDPMDYSLVVQGGNNAFAAVVAGDFDPIHLINPPKSYLDGLHAGYLVLDANRWNPLLVKTILDNKNFTFSRVTIDWGLDMPAVHDKTLGLTLILDPETYLPYIVRAVEDHPFFGQSTHDLRVYNYQSVEGVMIPRHFKTIYNSDKLVVDWQVDQVKINPELPATWFDGPNATFTKANIPYQNESMMVQVQEKSTNYIYFGLPYNGTVEAIRAEHSWPDLPGVWSLKLPEWYGYRQMVLEFDDFVVVMDCPPNQSHTVIAWVAQNIKKPIKLVVPTHHHHDHALGLPDYVKVGAKAVVPEFAKDYYKAIENIEFETFTQDQPYIIENDAMRAVFINMKKSVHAKDQVYAVVMPACVNDNSTVLAFDADHLSRDDKLDDYNDQAEFWEMLDNFKMDRVPRHMKLIPVHGLSGSIKLDPFLESVGISYPHFKPSDFMYSTPQCVE